MASWHHGIIPGKVGKFVLKLCFYGFYARVLHSFIRSSGGEGKIPGKNQVNTITIKMIKQQDNARI
jgi:hypothetical protein